MLNRNIVIAFLILLLSVISKLQQRCPDELPDQVHLSFGHSPHTITITWVTFRDKGKPMVAFKDLSCEEVRYAEGRTKKFVDCGKEKKVRYIHKVTIFHLKPETVYAYKCRNSYKWSTEYHFKTVPSGCDWSPRLIIYGDMGVKGAATFNYIRNEVKRGLADAIIHVGDFAYNMENNNGDVGDAFLRMLEPIASQVPYMTAVGNHEQAYNFSHYKNRFSMPGKSEGLYYSFDLGPVHFVAISTEVYYYLNYGFQPLIKQYKWLVNDLQMASKPENRKIRPWIILYGHRPMYCTSKKEDCSWKHNKLKNGFPPSNRFALEDLLFLTGVDLAFWGHMHNYQRTLPIFNNKIYNVSCKDVYINPGATVHIITGAAGMKSGTDKIPKCPVQDSFAFLNDDFSYTKLNILNKTHLHLEQISASKHGKVIDSFWMIKNTCD